MYISRRNKCEYIHEISHPILGLILLRKVELISIMLDIGYLLLENELLCASFFEFRNIFQTIQSEKYCHFLNECSRMY